MTDKNLQKAKEEIARRSGLSVAVVTTLLDSGYSYVETIHEPVKWIRDARFNEIKATFVV